MAGAPAGDTAQAEVPIEPDTGAELPMEGGTDMVGLAIAEHLPWDALNLHNFLSSLPIFGA